MNAKKFEDGKKMKGIVPDGDHVYYVAHKEPQNMEFNTTKNKKYDPE